MRVETGLHREGIDGSGWGKERFSRPIARNFWEVAKPDFWHSYHALIQHTPDLHKLYAGVCQACFEDYPEWAKEFPPGWEHLCGFVVPLHDLGKIRCADLVTSPAILTPQQRARVSQHVVDGAVMWLGLPESATFGMVRDCLDSLPGGSVYRWVGESIAYHHPHYYLDRPALGVEPESVPVAGRIMAVVDVIDAMMAWRSYRPNKRFSLREALEYLNASFSLGYDSRIVDSLAWRSNALERLFYR